MQDTRLKIDRAKVWLLMNQIFFGTLICKLKIVEREEIVTMGVDGINLFYNREWVDKLTEPELRGVLAHEVLHCAFMHHTRMRNRHHIPWNFAGDYAVNLVLTDAGFVLPTPNLLNETYREMGAEEIYTKLMNKNRNDSEDSAANWGKVIRSESAGAEKKAQEADWKIAVVQALNSAKRSKQCGSVPAGIERLIEEITKPQINWLHILQGFVTEKTRNDYSWHLPSRRYLPQGIYMPIMESRTLGLGVVYIDTSNSMDMKDLGKALGEISGISSSYHADLLSICFDADGYEPEMIKPGDAVKNIKLKGGGGTNPVPAFNYIGDSGYDIKFGVVLTDGEFESFPEYPPPYPVLWVLTRKTKFNPPFGETIYITK